MTAHEFLSRWHEAVLAKDATALSAIIAEGCELRSPVVWTPTQDKDYLIHILQGVIETVDGFAYRNEVIDGQDLQRARCLCLAVVTATVHQLDQRRNAARRRDGHHVVGVIGGQVP